MKALERIRPINLLIIALTQCFFYFTILQPAFQEEGILYNELVFSLVCVLTMLIAATGYIINDLLDSTIDSINHPERSPIDKKYWSKQYAIWVLVGMGINLIVCYLSSTWIYLWVYPLAVFMLYLYSSHFKCKGLIGNLIVSLFSALVVGILLLPLIGQFTVIPEASYLSVMNSFLYYFILGFLISVIREIVKDMEDVEGDAQCGCNTVAVALGNRIAKIYAIFFIIILEIVLALWLRGVWGFYKDWQLIYIILSVCLPMIYIFIKIWNAKVATDYSSISTHLKTIMILGILFLFISQISI